MTTYAIILLEQGQPPQRAFEGISTHGSASARLRHIASCWQGEGHELTIEGDRLAVGDKISYHIIQE